jgi:hypothetical protein
VITSFLNPVVGDSLFFPRNYYAILLFS